MLQSGSVAECNTTLYMRGQNIYRSLSTQLPQLVYQVFVMKHVGSPISANQSTRSLLWSPPSQSTRSLLWSQQVCLSLPASIPGLCYGASRSAYLSQLVYQVFDMEPVGSPIPPSQSTRSLLWSQQVCLSLPASLPGLCYGASRSVYLSQLVYQVFVMEPVGMSIFPSQSTKSLLWSQQVCLSLPASLPGLCYGVCRFTHLCQIVYQVFVMIPGRVDG